MANRLILREDFCEISGRRLNVMSLPLYHFVVLVHVMCDVHVCISFLLSRPSHTALHSLLFVSPFTDPSPRFWYLLPVDTTNLSFSHVPAPTKEL
jgi:hypothetical protein